MPVMKIGTIRAGLVRRPPMLEEVVQTGPKMYTKRFSVALEDAAEGLRESS